MPSKIFLREYVGNSFIMNISKVHSDWTPPPGSVYPQNYEYIDGDMQMS